MLRVNDDEETAAASIAATTAAGADASSMHSAAEGSSSSEAVAPELKKRKRSVTTDLDETIEVDRRAPAQVSLLVKTNANQPFMRLPPKLFAMRHPL